MTLSEDPILNALSIGFWVFFTAFMVGTVALLLLIDPAKVEADKRKVQLVRASIPPRRVLTQMGIRVWWLRWILLAISLVLGAFAAERYKKQNQQVERNAGSAYQSSTAALAVEGSPRRGSP